MRTLCDMIVPKAVISGPVFLLGSRPHRACQPKGRDLRSLKGSREIDEVAETTQSHDELLGFPSHGGFLALERGISIYKRGQGGNVKRYCVLTLTVHHSTTH